MNVAITIPTGRPNVKQVVKAFIENAEMHGYDTKDFSVYLSIDTEFKKTKVSDFKLDPQTASKVKVVRYISNKKRTQIGKQIAASSGASYEVVEKLFIGRGYSKQRNVALIMAIHDGNDFAICLDDDEAPFIPVQKKNGEIYWENLDFFTPHLKELSSGTDITRGPYMGYQSPIPSDFDKDIPKEIRIKLGEALRFGSDVIKKYTFFDLINQIKYLPESTLKKKKSIIVREGPNGKHIYAGNMGINLNSVRAGRIPIFYTPPAARGEDTIFALQLSKVVVKEVRSYIFHDPFQMYPEIFSGEFPERLARIPINQQSKERFANALIGWIKYAPLLIEMTSTDVDKKSRKINNMLEKIEEPTRELSTLMDLPGLVNCKSILMDYQNEVKLHKDELVYAQAEWKDKIIPIV